MKLRIDEHNHKHPDIKVSKNGGLPVGDGGGAVGCKTWSFQGSKLHTELLNEWENLSEKKKNKFFLMEEHLNKFKSQTFSKIEDMSDSTYNKLVSWLLKKEPHLKDLKDAIEQINCSINDKQTANTESDHTCTKRQFSPLIVAIIGTLLRKSNDLKLSQLLSA